MEIFDDRRGILDTFAWVGWPVGLIYGGLFYIDHHAHRAWHADRAAAAPAAPPAISPHRRECRQPIKKTPSPRTSAHGIWRSFLTSEASESAGGGRPIDHRPRRAAATCS